MSEKYCEEHDGGNSVSYRKKLCGLLLVLLFLIIFTIILVWAILNPSRPRITLQDATILSFKLAKSPPYYLNATMQVTLDCRNPNDRIGIVFQSLDVSAYYKTQQITLRTTLPTGYLTPNDDTTWSPLLCSVNSPIAPSLVAELVEELQRGAVVLKVKMIGRIKWKIGTWMSGVYHMYADCPAYIGFGSSQVGTVDGHGIKFQLDAQCGVDVGI